MINLNDSYVDFQAVLARLHDISVNQNDPALDVCFTAKAFKARRRFAIRLGLLLDVLEGYNSELRFEK